MMQIGHKDIIWNYAATFLKIASSAILLPLILRKMPSEMVGIWSVFMTITAFSGLLDFGFNPSFTRNVTYIFSGVKSLKINGYEYVAPTNQTIDFGLLNGIINAMRWFYLRMALILLLLLSTFGTYYIYKLLRQYTGNHQEVYIAWMLLCLISTYNLFTLYYESLLQGRGFIKRSKQIIIIGQSIYLIIASFMILFGMGLIAIVSAQISSIVIVRWMSYHSFFTQEIKQKLHFSISRPKQEVIQAITPNALKIGLTSLGGFMVQRSAIIIGSLFLTLEEIASYGITIQLITVIAGLAGLYTMTYQPKIAQLRIENNNKGIKELYIRGQLVLLLTYIAGGVVLMIFGEWSLKLIGSQTHLIPQPLVFMAIIVYFLESNHSIAGMILLSKNEVPFFKASLISGGSTIVLLLLLFLFTNSGLWLMIAAPGIAQGVYQNWKWPKEVIKELEITVKDIILIVKTKQPFQLNGRI